MTGKSSTKAANGHTRRKTLRDVVKGQGRSFVWLAAQTGYSAEHISGVANGDREGSMAFHISMKRVLGEDYAS